MAVAPRVCAQAQLDVRARRVLRVPFARGAAAGWVAWRVLVALAWCNIGMRPACPPLRT